MRALDAFVWAPLSSHSLVYRKARRNEVGSATQSSNAASPALTNYLVQAVYRRLELFAIEQGPHEHAVMSQNTTALISNAICLDKLLVDAKVASIGFVVRQAWKAKKRQCAIACPF